MQVLKEFKVKFERSNLYLNCEFLSNKVLSIAALSNPVEIRHMLQQALLMWLQPLILQFHYYFDNLKKTTFLR